MSLYFFIFEMYFVYARLQSNSLDEYRVNVRRIRRSKFLVMVGYGALEYPLSTFTYIITKVASQEDFFTHKSFIIMMVVITRTLLITIEPYMYTLFFRLLNFFFRKHVNASLKNGVSRQAQISSQPKLCLLKTWIMTLTILKMIHSLCIVTLFTVYQLVDKG